MGKRYIISVYFQSHIEYAARTTWTRYRDKAELFGSLEEAKQRKMELAALEPKTQPHRFAFMIEEVDG